MEAVFTEILSFQANAQVLLSRISNPCLPKASIGTLTVPNCNMLMLLRASAIAGLFVSKQWLIKLDQTSLFKTKNGLCWDNSVIFWASTKRSCPTELKYCFSCLLTLLSGLSSDFKASAKSRISGLVLISTSLP